MSTQLKAIFQFCTSRNIYIYREREREKERKKEGEREINNLFFIFHVAQLKFPFTVKTTDL